MQTPVRLVIGYSDKLWVDNLHTCLSYIVKHGEDILLSEMPVYIIDLREELHIVVDIENSIIFDKSSIEGAIDCARKRISRVHIDLYDINYTIGDFIKDNRIFRNSMSLDDKYFN